MVDSVYKVVSHRNRELHATMNAIKDQCRLMRIEVETGAFYGDERANTGVKPHSPAGNGLLVDEEEDIGRLLDAAEASPSEVDQPVDEPSPAPQPVDEPSPAPQPVDEPSLAPQPVEGFSPTGREPSSAPATPSNTDAAAIERFFQESPGSKRPKPAVSDPDLDELASLLDSV
jgi:hypothetical protein